MSTRDDYGFPPATRRYVKGIIEFWDDGRPLEEIRREQAERIASEGIETPASLFRIEMIRGLDLRPREWGAPTGEPDKNVIILGCHPLLGGIQEIQAFVQLLQRFGETYTFLPKEYCCAGWLPLLNIQRGDKAGREAAFERTRENIGTNIAEARRLGAKAMYYVCSACAYHARQFYRDCDIQQRYYADLIVDLVREKQPRFKLEAEVAYYTGCQAKGYALGGPDAGWDWRGYRETLERVEGLRLKDIPRYCCNTDWERISKAVEKTQVETTVTPCWDCSGVLRVRAPDLATQGLSQIVLRALQS